MEKQGTLPVSASKVDRLVAVVPVAAAEEDVQEVVAVVVVEAATTVASRVTCHVTARKADLAVAAAAVAVTERVTTVVRLAISRASALARWEVVEEVIAQIPENVTTVMEVGTCLVIVQRAERDQTEVVWNVTSAMKWVILHEIVQTPVEVEVLDHAMASAAVVAAAAVVVVALTCVATTATRWATSRATVQLYHHRQCHK